MGPERVVDDTMTQDKATGDVVENSDTTHEGGTFYSRWLHKQHAKIGAGFARLGYWVASHRRTTIITTLTVCFICFIGLLNAETESDGDILYTPDNSREKKDLDTIEANFPSGGGTLDLLFTAGGANVLTLPYMEQIWSVYLAGVGVETGAGDFASLCKQNFDGSCQLGGVVQFWGGDYDLYQAEVSTESDLLQALSATVFPDGEFVASNAIFGRQERDSSGILVSAEGVTAAAILDEQDDDAEDRSLDFQKKWIDATEIAVAGLTDGLEGFYFAGRSLDDELERSVGGETYLFVLVYVVMIIFASITIGRRNNSVERRSVAGVLGVMSVAISLFASFGLGAAFGIPVTSLNSVLPFIIVGIGVDDMYIIAAAFDMTPMDESTPSRMAGALSRCGLSITYTSLTDITAFLLGSLTTLPAVRWLCYYAALAILLDFLMQITFFVAVLAYDNERQRAGRLDCLCCFKSKAFISSSTTTQNSSNVNSRREEEEKTQEDGVANSVTASASNGDKASPSNLLSLSSASFTRGPRGMSEKQVVSDAILDSSKLAAFFHDYYMPFLMKPLTKAAVLMVTLAMLCAAIWGITEVEEGFDLVTLVPDNSYVKAYVETARNTELFTGISDFVPIYQVADNLDYEDVAVQRELNRLIGDLEDVPRNSGPVDSWLQEFLAWAAEDSTYSSDIDSDGFFSSDRGNFYPALREYLTTSTGSRFTDLIVFEEEIVTADGEAPIRITMYSRLYMNGVEEVQPAIDSLEMARDVMETSDLVPRPYVFSRNFIFTSQFLVIYEELTQNLILVIVAVFVFSLFILARVRYTILTCLVIALVDANILAGVYYWGLEINSVTTIQLVMAVGLIVDWIAHPIDYYLLQDKALSTKDRVIAGMSEIGPSVFLGGGTTLLGIIPLGFAQNDIFRIFCRMFFCIIVFGVFHGIVFVPVLLSFDPTKNGGHSLPSAAAAAAAIGDTHHDAQQNGLHAGPGKGNGSQAVIAGGG